MAPLRFAAKFDCAGVQGGGHRKRPNFAIWKHCLKGPEPGQCGDYIERFFFDKRSQECTTFIYRDGKKGMP